MSKTIKGQQRQYEFLYKHFGTPKTEVLSGLFLPLPLRGFVVWGLLWGLMSLHIPKWYMLYFGVHMIVLLLLGLRVMRTRRFGELLLFQIVSLLPVTIDLVVAGVLLIFTGQDISMLFVIGFTALAFFSKIARFRNETLRWELARRQNLLKPFLNEREWSIKNFQTLEFRYALARAQKREKEERELMRMIAILDKWSPLVPGAAMLFHRSFGHTATLEGVIVLLLGLLLFGGALDLISRYLKIREWDREKGRYLVIAR